MNADPKMRITAYKAKVQGMKTSLTSDKHTTTEQNQSTIYPGQAL